MKGVIAFFLLMLTILIALLCCINNPYHRDYQAVVSKILEKDTSCHNVQEVLLKYENVRRLKKLILAMDQENRNINSLQSGPAPNVGLQEVRELRQCRQNLQQLSSDYKQLLTTIEKTKWIVKNDSDNGN